MPVDADAAVNDQLPDLLALGMALTGRREACLDLVGEVVVLARPRRSGSDPSDPVALRNLLVQRYLAGRSVTEPGPHDPSDPASPSDELDRVVARLAQLPRLDRAAVALSHRERVTAAEIAGILDRPGTTITRALNDADTRLQATPYEIVAALDRLAWAAPDPAAVRPAAVRFERRRTVRRRRLAGLATVAVAALVLAVAIPMLILPRLFPVHVRQPDEWALGYRLVLPPGWSVRARYLEFDQDTAYLVSQTNEDLTCEVTASAAGRLAQPTPSSRPTRVHGKAGWFTGPPTPTLTWRYAPSAVASVSCNQIETDAFLLEVADGVTFASTSLALPFRLSALPTGYRVQGVGTYVAQTRGDADLAALLLLPIGALPTSSETIYLSVPGGDLQYPSPHTVRVEGADAVLESDDGGLSLCLPERKRTACLFATPQGPGGPRTKDDPYVRRLIEIAGNLVVVADLADRSTWIDARDAVPH